MKSPVPFLGRIAIAYRGSNIDSIPCLCNLLWALAETGYEVDVFCLQDSVYIAPSFSSSAINVFANYPGWRARGLLGFVGNSKILALFALRRHMRRRYVSLIGVDAQGLIDAADFNRFLKVPVIYFSTEILPLDEIDSDSLRAAKEREIEICKDVKMVVIQDEERAELLRRDVDIPLSKFVFLPNSPRGSSKRRRSSFLRRRFGLAENDLIVLHTGTVASWACVHQLVVSTWEWPKDVVLIIHNRRRGAWSSEYDRVLRFLAKKSRVFFSDEPVSAAVYPDIVASADIGIVFYEPSFDALTNGKNIQHIGLSSGKLAYFLQAGIPIIANDISAVGRIVRQYKCGILTSDPANTCPGLDEIKSQYENISKNALVAFSAELDCERALINVVNRIKALM